MAYVGRKHIESVNEKNGQKVGKKWEPMRYKERDIGAERERMNRSYIYIGYGQTVALETAECLQILVLLAFGVSSMTWGKGISTSLFCSCWTFSVISLTVVGIETQTRSKIIKKPSKLKNEEKLGHFQMWQNSVFISEKSNSTGDRGHQVSFRNFTSQGLWRLQDSETPFNLAIQCCCWSAFFKWNVRECPSLMAV